MTVLAHIAPAELRGVWQRIRPRVEAIATKQAEAWIADDVFAEILAGTAWLWATPDLGCFVVLQVAATAYDRALHVWIASEETDARAVDFMPQLQAIAREAQCSRVDFVSARRWERALPGLRVRRIYSFEA
ncbi:hypothetical protein [Sphingomonas baiyangensis]|uniref:Uncharacterized protein n=1 Tax=Sphingomonas baiyangensis TaxID=2572576 RepID=A0A4U1L2Y1_9SPHN|nr:hypothetical protein [Sphingomonas baiyangensis]TKD50580.1 hypothetical protein FBR43_07225 [Sphingomonas baiyangensis]